jgi:nucleoside-diphosphate-sugar epimerase
MRYALTGGTGFIGGVLARHLVEAGHSVHALVRDAGRADELRRLGVRLFAGDVTAPETLPPLMAGVDGLFHVAAWYKIGARDREAASRVNVEGTRHVLEAMRAAGVAKGVYTSTIAVHSDTRGRTVDETYRHEGPLANEYERTKWLAHYEVALPMAAAGLPLVIVQPGVVYGPGDTSSVRAAVLDFLDGRLPVLPAGTAMSWAHVEDVARGHVLAMERGRPGESYILAGEALSFVEVFRRAERFTGVRGPRVHPPPAMTRASAALMGLVEKVVPLPPMFTGEGLRLMAGTTYLASSAKAERELGYVSRPFDEGWRETLAHELRLLGRPVPVRGGRD